MTYPTGNDHSPQQIGREAESKTDHDTLGREQEPERKITEDIENEEEVEKD